MAGAINESQVTRSRAILDKGQPESEEVQMYRRPASDFRQIRCNSGLAQTAFPVVASVAWKARSTVPMAAEVVPATGAIRGEPKRAEGAAWSGADDKERPKSADPTKGEFRDRAPCAVAIAAAQPVAATVSGPAPTFCVLVVGAGRRMPKPAVHQPSSGPGSGELTKLAVFQTRAPIRAHIADRGIAL